MCFRTFIILFVCACLFATPHLKAQVGPYTYRTLEERVLNSETVLVAKILKITGERRQLGQDTYKIAFETEKIIKGIKDAIPRDELDSPSGYFYLFARRNEIEDWIKSSARLVLHSPAESNLSSEYARVMVDLSLKKSLHLSLAEDGVLCALTNEDDILAAIKHTAQEMPGATCVRTHQMMTEEKLVKAANLIIQDGFPIAFVPVDKPLEKWAKRKITSGGTHSIESAVAALEHFRSDTNTDWVRKEIAKREPGLEQVALSGLLKAWDLSAK
ncbi:hypothetical protein N9B12_00830 [bacterium]|nr:hypothetical protein [Mariniblastus sp.]MDA7887581.1 hypothetical protein [bacterium]MDA7904367.1 hypothetical protein [bacterium]MDA7913358.1 hypothetical protein [bacterium]MDA7924922.1 hypothetical protein [Mariniblastus sp.]